MGVFICPCKLFDKVYESCDSDKYKKLMNVYESKGLEVVRIKDNDKCEPFESGVYVYETCEPTMDMSYGTNLDFTDCLRDFYDDYDGDEPDKLGTFLTTTDNSNTDGCISYVIAKDMLEEFEEGLKNGIEAYIYKRYGEDYGNLIWYNYRQYMGVLRACVDNSCIIWYK